MVLCIKKLNSQMNKIYRKKKYFITKLDSLNDVKNTELHSLFVGFSPPTLKYDLHNKLKKLIPLKVRLLDKN